MDPRAFEHWPLREWNRRLVEGTFLRPDSSGLFREIVHLDVGPLSFARYAGIPLSESEKAFRRFCEVLGAHMLAGRKSFDRDADRLEAGWNPASPDYPPFWSHLLFSCYAADTVESEDRDFRRRLAELLKLRRSPQLSRLLPRLWEKVAKWSQNRRTAGVDCRVLVLPDPGSFTIIGYSLGLGFPRLRDNHLLADVLGRTSFLGKEPPVRPVFRAIEGKLREFTPSFRAAFGECRDSFAHTGSVNWFWSCVREAALFARWTAPNESHWTALLSVGRRAIVLSLASSEQYSGNKWGTFEGRFASLGWLSVVYESLDGSGIEQAVLHMFGSSIQTPQPMREIRGVISTGVMLLALETPGVYRASLQWPESGPVAIICLESIGARVARKLSRDCVALNISGWCLIEAITLEELATVRSLLPKIYQDGVLSQTAPPARLIRRGGFVADFSKTSYLGLANLTPTFHIGSADEVTALLEDGTSQSLLLDKDADGWRLPGAPFNGIVRLAATYAGKPIAALDMDFRCKFESYPDIKMPTAPLEWWTESIHGASVSSADLFKTAKFIFDNLPDFHGLSERMVENPASPSLLDRKTEKRAPDSLREAMASCFSQRRSVSLDEWFEWSSRAMQLTDNERWECLRLWQYAGLLYRIRPKAWAGSQIFGAAPHFFVFRSGSMFFAKTAGLFTTVMLARLIHYCIQQGLPVRPIGTDAMLPSSFLLGAATSDQLRECAAELGITLKPVQPQEGALALQLDVSRGEVSSLPPLDAKPDKVIPVMTGSGLVQIERFRSEGIAERYVVRFTEAKPICFLTSFAAFSAVFQLSGSTFLERVSPEGIAASQWLPNLPAAIGTYLLRYSEKGGGKLYNFISGITADYVLNGLNPPHEEETQQAYSHFAYSRSWQAAFASKNKRQIVLPPSLFKGGVRVVPAFAMPWLVQDALPSNGCNKKVKR